MPKPIKLLMVSFHFPPVSGSSGFLRTLKFAEYLSRGDRVRPHVLTIAPHAYEQTNEKNAALLDALPCPVSRAQGFDASRHFAVRGKYFGFMTLPDKWSSWVPFALLKAWLLNRTSRFDAVFTTFPISSALLIGYWLSKWFKKPLIVDLRDPVWEEETWQNTRKQRLLRRIEENILGHAQCILFTSPGTIEKYRHRYPAWIDAKARLISNGYDESDFHGLTPHCEKHGKRVVLHSGLIPVYERNPDAFFLALQDLKQRQVIDGRQIEFRLRATGHDNAYTQRVTELGIDDLVTFAPPVAYRQALQEMLGADALMIFQDSTCNWQIPAKLFEYFRASLPVWAFTDVHSDTANLLQAHSDNYLLAPLSSPTAIASAIEGFLAKQDWQGRFQDTERFTRENLSRQLQTVLSDVCADAPDN